MNGDKAIRDLQRRLAESVDLAQIDFAEAVRALALAHADPQRRREIDARRERIAEIVSRILAAGDLSARIELRFGSPAAEPAKFATYQIVGTPLSFDVPGFDEPVPDVEFVAAVEDLRSRDPLGAAELEAMGASVADLYGGSIGSRGTVVYPHGFSAARAADNDTAERVRDLLAEGLSGGAATPRVVQRLVEAWDWPSAYSEMVVRTNYNVATSAGRFREAERVERTTGIRCGFRYVATRDPDVRRGRPQDKGENHLALDGLVARQDDPIWRRWSPPGGYACRCTLEVLIGDEVPESFASVPPGAAFAPGFGMRADLRTYG